MSTRKLARIFVAIILAAAAAAVAPGPAAAAGTPAATLDRFVVERRVSPAFAGKSFGPAGPYELIVARAYMSLAPHSRINRRIVDIDMAPTDRRGRVTYDTQVVILRPIDLSKGSGNLVYEVINRSLGGIDLDGKALDRTGLYDVLLARGDVIVNAAWQGELTPQHPVANLDQLMTMLGSKPIYAALPPALEGGQPVVRRIRAQMAAFDPLSAQPVTRIPLDYPATKTPDLKGYWRRHESDMPRAIPADKLRLTDPYHLSIDPVPGAVAYDIFYNAAGSTVAGTGFAVPRDLISFLRHDRGDARRGVNPLLDSRGQPAIHRAYAIGLSQSGRYLRGFLRYGFNEDASGRAVFDGLLPVVAGGRGGYFNSLFASPGLIPGELAGHRDLDIFPFAYPVLEDPVSGRRDGLLRLCQQTDTCPKVIQIDSENEVATGWGWMLTTRPDGGAIDPQPDNVRLYAIAGGDHSGVRAMAICRGQAPAPVRWQPYVRAAFVLIDEWARRGTPPPPSRYPTLADGTLVSAQEAKGAWPHIAGYPFVTARNLPEYWVAGDPLPVSRGAYPFLVPARDADGNALGGIHDPLLAVPMGTLSGVGARKAGFGPEAPCPLVGEYVPFAATRAERLANGDPRLSLEERYPGGAAEVQERRRAVAHALMRDRQVLARDESDVAKGP